MSAYEWIGARLAVEQATIDAYRLLDRAGIESVVLRGPLLTRALYEPGENRTSIDVDLLVPDLPVGSEELERAGYVRIVDWTSGMEKHGWTHAKENSVTVDLHHTLVGIEAPSQRAWEVLHRESEEVTIGATSVRAPVLAAQLTIVALHAAQHGPAAAKVIEDLRRALDRFDDELWTQAKKLATELDAEQAFAAGLELVESGRALAGRLGLPAAVSRTALLRASSVRPTALGLDRLLSLRGVARWSFLWGKLVPPPAFMRNWRPLARRGPVGLGLAYLYRLAWLAWRLPRGFMSLRTAGGRAKSDAARRRGG